MPTITAADLSGGCRRTITALEELQTLLKAEGEGIPRLVVDGSNSQADQMIEKVKLAIQIVQKQL